MHHYEEDNDSAHADFIDWKAWVPPMLKLAFFRRTGESCRMDDWEDLEKDCISWIEADEAKRHTSRSISKAILEGYPRRMKDTIKDTR